MPPRSPDWDETFDILRDIMFGYRAYMDAHEREVFAFIYGRTQLYGKSWEYIPYDHFLEGVYNNATGDVVAAPLIMGKPALRAALKHLKAKGIIEVLSSLTAPNNYRIKERPEIDKGHVQAYIRRNQPRLHAYVQRTLQSAAMAARPRNTAVAVIDAYPNNEEMQGLPEPQGRVRLDPKPGSTKTQQNSTYYNKPILNTAVRSAPSGSLRKLTLKKGL